MHAYTNRHLARNPFICDCNLRWLGDYLHKNTIETSGARCDAPKRMHRRKIEALRDEKFKCEFLFILILIFSRSIRNVSSFLFGAFCKYFFFFFGKIGEFV